MAKRDCKELEERIRDLEQSEKTLRAIFSSIPTGIGILENRIMKWHNRAMSEMLGYTPEELHGRTARELYLKDDEFSRAKETFASAAKGGKSAVLETWWVRKDGTMLDCLIRYAPLAPASGREAAVVIVEDITDRRQAEEALRQSEARYREILDNIEDVYYEVDLAGNLTFFNEALCTLAGLSRDELMGLNSREYTDEKTAKKIFKVFNQVYTTGEPARAFDWDIVRRDGSKAHLEASISLIRNQEEEAIGFRGIVRDVTERERLRRDLQLSEERYRSLVENTLDGYFICEIPSGRFIFLNQRSCDIYGYTMKEGLALTVWDVMVPADHSRIRNRIQKRIEGERSESERRVYTGVRKDGSTFRVEISTSLVDYQGKISVQGVIKDITEQERLELQLRQAQKMEAIGTLAGGIAHDFNNLLQAILGYTQILTMGKEEDDPERSKLEQIEKSAMRASELTQQLLAFSRKVESRLRPVDLNLEVRQVRKLLKRTIPKMIIIELHLQDDLMVVNADPAQIEQVIMNLAVNARDAMPEGGKIVIETENVFLDTQYCKTHPGAVPGEYVCLSFTDTGHGMKTEAVEHIFEPFYTTKEVGKGTGLGLSMVYGIVKSHGGYIMCYSEPGEGTTFKIYLPAVENKNREEEKEKKEEEELPGGTETILLVDDEELLRDIGKEILEDFGYAVLTAPDGETALELYKNRKGDISLIILDLMMPGMGGKQCLEQILAMAPEAKVVIASGYSVNGPTKAALEVGARGFIKKPFELKQMLKVVREVLEQGKNSHDS